MEKVKTGLVFYFLAMTSIVFAQNDTITISSGDLFLYLTSFIDNIPSSGDDNYTEPNAQEVLDWREMISYAINENWTAAHNLAGDLNYRIDSFQDSILNRQYFLIERNENGPYWGSYVFRPNACREDLVLMAPHARFDTNTGDEATYCFLQTDSYALMLPGTHRCNSTTFSTCSGSTSVCSSSSEDYRISDVAHTTTSIWQSTVELLSDSLPGSYFIQLHGFAKQTSDPYVIMSNGTRDVPSFDPLSEMAAYLKIIDPVLTFKIAHIDQSWTRLLGFSNTNGRYINHSTFPCTSNAINSEGRFLHIEQEKLRLRQNADGWDKMARAIRATFPGDQCPSIIPRNNQHVWYVEQGKSGDAKSWSTAHGDAARVLDLADAGDSIFISQGTYLPTEGTNQDAAFEIRSGVSIFGGFPTGGSAFSLRNSASFQVVFSSDIGVPGVLTDDVFHTFKVHFLDQDCLLDGVQIEPGVDVSGSSILTFPESNAFQIVLKNVFMRR